MFTPEMSESAKSKITFFMEHGTPVIKITIIK
jgi:hypothetical protein